MLLRSGIPIHLAGVYPPILMNVLNPAPGMAAQLCMLHNYVLQPQAACLLVVAANFVNI